MPTVTIVSDFDVQALLISGVYSSNQEDPTYAGHNSSSTNAAIYRNVMRFQTTSIPANAVPSFVSLQVNIVDVTNMSSRSMRIGGYGGNGQGDPSFDSSVLLFARSDVASLGGYGLFTDFGTGGLISMGFGGNVLNDFQQCVALRATFSLALQLDNESGSIQERSGWDAQEHSSNKPQILVSYSIPISDSGPWSARKRRQLSQLLAG
jgi:hypothetical protein